MWYSVYTSYPLVGRYSVSTLEASVLRLSTSGHEVPDSTPARSGIFAFNWTAIHYTETFIITLQSSQFDLILKKYQTIIIIISN